MYLSPEARQWLELLMKVELGIRTWVVWVASGGNNRVIALSESWQQGVSCFSSVEELDGLSTGTRGDAGVPSCRQLLACRDVLN